MSRTCPLTTCFGMDFPCCVWAFEFKVSVVMAAAPPVAVAPLQTGDGCKTGHAGTCCPVEEFLLWGAEGFLCTVHRSGGGEVTH